MSRTACKEVFKFNELSDKAKEKAREWARSIDDLYAWGQENSDSLKGFAEHFNLSKLDWDITLWGNSRATGKVPEELESLQGVRLWKWLQNSGKLRGDLLAGNSPFTGYVFDENLLDPIRAFIKKPNVSTTYQGLIDDCLSEWVKAYISDWEYAYSDEGIDDFLIANEYEFEKNGKRYI